MTPTHKELVEALREAKEALEFYADEASEHLPDSYEDDFGGMTKFEWDSGERAESALSKINPILKELEAKQ